ncbi:MAG: tetratricopeptide repeat protein, partial [Hyphomonas sp.]|nr:tetratricopeptide repeat protein [Hyphomonas sp.]
DGYEGDQSHKHARNMPLLKRAIAVDPHRVYLRFHLGMTLMELGRTDEACSQLRAGMEMATRDGASERARVEGSSCAQLLSAMFLANGQAAAALEMARQGRALYQGNLALCWGEGRCLLDLGQPAEAIEAVEPLLSLDPEQVFDPKIAYQKSLFRSDSLGVIGSAWFALGEPERAAFFFDEAANHAAAPREYVAKAALARSRARRSVHN